VHVVIPVIAHHISAARNGDVAHNATMIQAIPGVWATVKRVNLLERFLGMVKEPPDEDTAEGRSIIMGRWEMGTEPASGQIYWEIMEGNREAWREAWRRAMGENVVLRTDSRWVGTVKDLGYESMSVTWGVEPAIGQVIWRDVDLVRASQERLREAQVIPDESLAPGRLANLQLARGHTTVDTMVHEIAHHTSRAEDRQSAHNEAMTKLAAPVVRRVAAGAFDEELKEVE